MATKYPNNFEVQLNQPLDTKLVCDNLSDLTDYLYVGLLTYCRSTGKYYYIKEINDSVPTWEKFSGGINLTSNGSDIVPTSDIWIGSGLSLSTSDGLNTISLDPYVIRVGSSWDAYGNLRVDTKGIGLFIGSGLQYEIDPNGIINLQAPGSSGSSGSTSSSEIKIGTNTSYNITELILSTEYSLGYTSDSKLAILLGSGLSRKGETGEIQINLGTGLTLADDKIAVSYPQQFLDVGIGLKYSNDNTIIFDAASGSGLYPDNGGIYIETKIREVTTDSFKTINGNSILGSGDIEINTTLGASDFINGGVINITTTGDIEEIYNSLDTGAIALCIIGDSSGSYPSSETRVNVNSAYTVSANYFFSEDARGANVGDMLMITKQTYLLINRCALKIIPINDSKVATDEYTGTDGIMTVWDKTRINKVDGIEWTANDTRAWLNSVVNTDLRKTKYGYGTALEDCIKTGALAYTGAEIAGINANWTIFVDCTTDTDGGGYYHVIQTAICRDEAYLGRIWKRFGYYTSSTAPEFLEWKEITNTGLEARIAALEAQISSMTTETEV